jgi:hypothetical protein
VRLVPGKAGNDVTQEQLGHMESDEQFKLWCRLGWVAIRRDSVAEPGDPAREAEVEAKIAEVIKERAAVVAAAEPGDSVADGPADADPQVPRESAPALGPESLKSENVIKAREMIAACDDLDLLLSWFENDTRQTVQDAVEKRLNKLQAQE